MNKSFRGLLELISELDSRGMRHVEANEAYMKLHTPKYSSWEESQIQGKKLRASAITGYHFGEVVGFLCAKF